MITLGVYLAATAATAFSTTAVFFCVCRFITGTYWLGAAAGALLTVAAPHILSPFLDWRVCFGLGFVLGTAILIVRRHVPESPRWLLIHGREQEAEQITRSIEQEVAQGNGSELDPVDPDDTIKIHQRTSIGLIEIARTVLNDYPKRTALGLSLFIGQAVLYNSILFGYETLLSTFFGVSTADAPYYLVAFAAGNFLGPIVLGGLFDSVGRKPMIAGTYILSGLLLLILGGIAELVFGVSRAPASGGHREAVTVV
jgi:MFS family permease